jgi:hypothetical protein
MNWKEYRNDASAPDCFQLLSSFVISGHCESGGEGCGSRLRDFLVTA